MVKEVGEVVVNINGQDVRFRLKKLTFGERNALIRESMKIKTGKTGETDTEMDVAKFQELLLYYTIVEPEEYARNQVKIDGLPFDVGDKLIQKAMEINGFNTENKKK